MTVSAPASADPEKTPRRGPGPSPGVLHATTAARLAAGFWTLWATTLIGGTLLSFREPDSLPWPTGTLLLFSHLGSSLCLVAAAWIWFLGFSRSAAANTARTVYGGDGAGNPRRLL